MKYVRVKQSGTGHELSVPEEHYDNAPKGAYKLLEDKAATDAGGTPYPPKYMTTVDEAAKKSDAPNYGKRLKADLEAEVATRNTGRAEQNLIVVEGNGTVADLVAALEADDAAQDADPPADATTTDGQLADPSEENN